MNATEASSPYSMLSSNRTGSGYITASFPQNVDGYHLDQHPCQKISWAPCPTPIQTKVINLYLNRNLFLVYLYVKNTLTSLSLSLSCIIQPWIQIDIASAGEPRLTSVSAEAPPPKSMWEDKHNNVFLKSTTISNSQCTTLANTPCASKWPSRNATDHSANTQARNNSLRCYAQRSKTQQCAPKLP